MIGDLFPAAAAERFDFLSFAGKFQADDLFDDTPQENFSGTRIYYSNALKVTEYSEFFIIYMKKSNFYVLPKKEFSEQETELLRTEFSKNLGKGFSKKMR